MRGAAQQAADAKAMAHFGLSRFLRQVGLSAFLLLPMGIWLWWHRVERAAVCGWGRERWGQAVGLGILIGMVVLFLRARPFAPERLAQANVWWALVTYTVVALGEETLYRGFLQGQLEAWLGRWWGYLTTALLFTALHLPARLLGGEPMASALTYALVQLLPMALLFGGTMLMANHAAAPALVHLAWNWASVLRWV